MTDPITRLRAFQRELEESGASSMSVGRVYGWDKSGPSRAKSLASDLGALLDEWEGMVEALENVEEFLEDRADAEYFTDSPSPVPNEAMRLFGEVQTALKAARGER